MLEIIVVTFILIKVALPSPIFICSCCP